jgi:hypothetical protein
MVLLATMLAYETVAAPLAQAHEYGDFWKSRRLAMVEPLEKPPVYASLPLVFHTAPQIASDVPLSGLNLPVKLGQMVEAHYPSPFTPLPKGRGEHLIIHLQDVHNIAGAQKNAAKILEVLKDNGKRPVTVAVEGAWGSVETDSLASFPLADVKRKVALEFLRNGKLFGEEARAVMDDPGAWKIIGIEDKDLYLANGRAKASVESAQSQVLPYLDSLKQTLQRLKGHLYLPELRAFERRRRAFQDERMSLKEYLRSIFDLDEAHQFPLPSEGEGRGEGAHRGQRNVFHRYPQLLLVLQLSALEDQLNISKVEKERTSLLEAAAGRLKKEDLNTLLTQSLEYRMGRLSPLEFHARLLVLAQTLQVPANALKVYTRYLKFHEALNTDGVIKELGLMEENVQGSLTQNRQARWLLQADRWVELQEKAWKLELTPEDFQKYEAIKNKLGWVQLSGKIKSLNDGLGLPTASFSVPASLFSTQPDVERFYTLALQRNEAMARNILNIIPRPPKGGEDKGEGGVVILIAGGFHTPGLTRIFKELNQSYIVIRPSLKADDDEPEAPALAQADTEGKTYRAQAFPEQNRFELSLALAKSAPGPETVRWAKEGVFGLTDAHGEEVLATARVGGGLNQSFFDVRTWARRGSEHIKGTISLAVVKPLDLAGRLLAKVARMRGESEGNLPSVGPNGRVLSWFRGGGQYTSEEEQNPNRGARLKRTSFSFTSFFAWMNPYTADNQRAPNDRQRNPQEWREPFKEVTRQPNSEDRLTQVNNSFSDKFRDKLPPSITENLHKGSSFEGSNHSLPRYQAPGVGKPFSHPPLVLSLVYRLASFFWPAFRGPGGYKRYATRWDGAALHEGLFIILPLTLVFFGVFGGWSSAEWVARSTSLKWAFLSTATGFYLLHYLEFLVIGIVNLARGKRFTKNNPSYVISPDEADYFHKVKLFPYAEPPDPLPFGRLVRAFLTRSLLWRLKDVVYVFAPLFAVSGLLGIVGDNTHTAIIYGLLAAGAMVSVLLHQARNQVSLEEGKAPLTRGKRNSYPPGEGWDRNLFDQGWFGYVPNDPTFVVPNWVTMLFSPYTRREDWHLFAGVLLDPRNRPWLVRTGVSPLPLVFHNTFRQILSTPSHLLHARRFRKRKDIEHALMHERFHYFLHVDLDLYEEILGFLEARAAQWKWLSEAFASLSDFYPSESIAEEVLIESVMYFEFASSSQKRTRFYAQLFQARSDLSGRVRAMARRAKPSPSLLEAVVQEIRRVAPLSTSVPVMGPYAVFNEMESLASLGYQSAKGRETLDNFLVEDEPPFIVLDRAWELVLQDKARVMKNMSGIFLTGLLPTDGTVNGFPNHLAQLPPAPSSPGLRPDRAGGLTLPSTVDYVLKRHGITREQFEEMPEDQRESLLKEARLKVAPWYESLEVFSPRRFWIGHEVYQDGYQGLRALGIAGIWAAAAVVSFLLGYFLAIGFLPQETGPPILSLVLGVFSAGASIYSGAALAHIRASRDDLLPRWLSLLFQVPLFTLASPAMLGGGVIHFLYNLFFPRAPLTARKSRKKSGDQRSVSREQRKEQIIKWLFGIYNDGMDEFRQRLERGVTGEEVRSFIKRVIHPVANNKFDESRLDLNTDRVRLRDLLELGEEVKNQILIKNEIAIEISPFQNGKTILGLIIPRMTETRVSRADRKIPVYSVLSLQGEKGLGRAIAHAEYIIYLLEAIERTEGLARVYAQRQRELQRGTFKYPSFALSPQFFGDWLLGNVLCQYTDPRKAALMVRSADLEEELAHSDVHHWVQLLIGHHFSTLSTHDSLRLYELMLGSNAKLLEVVRSASNRPEQDQRTLLEALIEVEEKLSALGSSNLPAYIFREFLEPVFEEGESGKYEEAEKMLLELLSERVLGRQVINPMGWKVHLDDLAGKRDTEAFNRLSALLRQAGEEIYAQEFISPKQRLVLAEKILQARKEISEKLPSTGLQLDNIDIGFWIRLAGETPNRLREAIDLFTSKLNPDTLDKDGQTAWMTAATLERIISKYASPSSDRSSLTLPSTQPPEKPPKSEPMESAERRTKEPLHAEASRAPLTASLEKRRRGSPVEFKVPVGEERFFTKTHLWWKHLKDEMKAETRRALGRKMTEQVFQQVRDRDPQISTYGDLSADHFIEEPIQLVLGFQDSDGRITRRIKRTTTLRGLFGYYGRQQNDYEVVSRLLLDFGLISENEARRRIKTIGSVKELLALRKKGYFKKTGYAEGSFEIPWMKLAPPALRELLEELAALRRVTVLDLSDNDFNDPKLKLKSTGQTLGGLLKSAERRIKNERIAKTPRWLILETAGYLDPNLRDFKQLRDSEDLRLMVESRAAHQEGDILWGNLKKWNVPLLRRLVCELVAVFFLGADTSRKVRHALKRTPEARLQQLAGGLTGDDFARPLPGLSSPGVPRSLHGLLEHFLRDPKQGRSRVQCLLEELEIIEPLRLSEAYTLEDLSRLAKAGILRRYLPLWEDPAVSEKALPNSVRRALVDRLALARGEVIGGLVEEDFRDGRVALGGFEMSLRGLYVHSRADPERKGRSIKGHLLDSIGFLRDRDALAEAVKAVKDGLSALYQGLSKGEEFFASEHIVFEKFEEESLRRDLADAIIRAKSAEKEIRRVVEEYKKAARSDKKSMRRLEVLTDQEHRLSSWRSGLLAYFAIIDTVAYLPEVFREKTNELLRTERKGVNPHMNGLMSRYYDPATDFSGNTGTAPLARLFWKAEAADESRIISLFETLRQSGKAIQEDITLRLQRVGDAAPELLLKTMKGASENPINYRHEGIFKSEPWKSWEAELNDKIRHRQKSSMGHRDSLENGQARGSSLTLPSTYEAWWFLPRWVVRFLIAPWWEFLASQNEEEFLDDHGWDQSPGKRGLRGIGIDLLRLGEIIAPLWGITTLTTFLQADGILPSGAAVFLLSLLGAVILTFFSILSAKRVSQAASRAPPSFLKKAAYLIRNAPHHLVLSLLAFIGNALAHFLYQITLGLRAPLASGRKPSQGAINLRTYLLTFRKGSTVPETQAELVEKFGLSLSGVSRILSELNRKATPGSSGHKLATYLLTFRKGSTISETRAELAEEYGLGLERVSEILSEFNRKAPGMRGPHPSEAGQNLRTYLLTFRKGSTIPETQAELVENYGITKQGVSQILLEVDRKARPVSRISKAGQNLRTYLLTFRKGSTIFETQAELAEKFGLSLSGVSWILSELNRKAALSPHSEAGQNLRTYLLTFRKGSTIPETQAELVEKFGLSLSGVSYILTILNRKATPGTLGRPSLTPPSTQLPEEPPKTEPMQSAERRTKEPLPAKASEAPLTRDGKQGQPMSMSAVQSQPPDAPAGNQVHLIPRTPEQIQYYLDLGRTLLDEGRGRFIEDSNGGQDHLAKIFERTDLRGPRRKKLREVVLLWIAKQLRDGRITNPDAQVTFVRKLSFDIKSVSDADVREVIIRSAATGGNLSPAARELLEKTREDIAPEGEMGRRRQYTYPGDEEMKKLIIEHRGKITAVADALDVPTHVVYVWFRPSGRKWLWGLVKKQQEREKEIRLKNLPQPSGSQRLDQNHGRPKKRRGLIFLIPPAMTGLFGWAIINILPMGQGIAQTVSIGVGAALSLLSLLFVGATISNPGPPAGDENPPKKAPLTVLRSEQTVVNKETLERLMGELRALDAKLTDFQNAIEIASGGLRAVRAASAATERRRNILLTNIQLAQRIADWILKINDALVDIGCRSGINVNPMVNHIGSMEQGLEGRKINVDQLESHLQGLAAAARELQRNLGAIQSELPLLPQGEPVDPLLLKRIRDAFNRVSALSLFKGLPLDQLRLSAFWEQGGRGKALIHIDLGLPHGMKAEGVELQLLGENRSGMVLNRLAGKLIAELCQHEEFKFGVILNIGRFRTERWKFIEDNVLLGVEKAKKGESHSFLIYSSPERDYVRTVIIGQRRRFEQLGQKEPFSYNVPDRGLLRDGGVIEIKIYPKEGVVTRHSPTLPATQPSEEPTKPKPMQSAERRTEDEEPVPAPAGTPEAPRKIEKKVDEAMGTPDWLRVGKFVESDEFGLGEVSHIPETAQDVVMVDFFSVGRKLFILGEAKKKLRQFKKVHLVKDGPARTLDLSLSESAEKTRLQLSEFLVDLLKRGYFSSDLFSGLRQSLFDILYVARQKSANRMEIAFWVGIGKLCVRAIDNGRGYSDDHPRTKDLPESLQEMAQWIVKISRGSLEVRNERSQGKVVGARLTLVFPPDPKPFREEESEPILSRGLTRDSLARQLPLRGKIGARAQGVIKRMGLTTVGEVIDKVTMEEFLSRSGGRLSAWLALQKALSGVDREMMQLKNPSQPSGPRGPGKNSGRPKKRRGLIFLIPPAITGLLGWGIIPILPMGQGIAPPVSIGVGAALFLLSLLFAGATTSNPSQPGDEGDQGKPELDAKETARRDLELGLKMVLEGVGNISLLMKELSESTLGPVESWNVKKTKFILGDVVNQAWSLRDLVLGRYAKITRVDPSVNRRQPALTIASEATGIMTLARNFVGILSGALGNPHEELKRMIRSVFWNLDRIEKAVSDARGEEVDRGSEWMGGSSTMGGAMILVPIVGLVGALVVQAAQKAGAFSVPFPLVPIFSVFGVWFLVGSMFPGWGTGWVPGSSGDDGLEAIVRKDVELLLSREFRKTGVKSYAHENVYYVPCVVDHSGKIFHVGSGDGLTKRLRDGLEAQQLFWVIIAEDRSSDEPGFVLQRINRTRFDPQYYSLLVTARGNTEIPKADAFLKNLGINLGSPAPESALETLKISAAQATYEIRMGASWWGEEKDPIIEENMKILSSSTFKNTYTWALYHQRPHIPCVVDANGSIVEFGDGCNLVPKIREGLSRGEYSLFFVKVDEGAESPVFTVEGIDRSREPPHPGIGHRMYENAQDILEESVRRATENPEPPTRNPGASSLAFMIGQFFDQETPSSDPDWISWMMAICIGVTALALYVFIRGGPVELWNYLWGLFSKTKAEPPRTIKPKLQVEKAAQRTTNHQTKAELRRSAYEVQRLQEARAARLRRFKSAAARARARLAGIFVSLSGFMERVGDRAGRNAHGIIVECGRFVARFGGATGLMIASMMVWVPLTLIVVSAPRVASASRWFGTYGIASILTVIMFPIVQVVTLPTIQLATRSPYYSYPNRWRRVIDESFLHHLDPFFSFVHKKRSWHQWAIGTPLIYLGAAGGWFVSPFLPGGLIAMLILIGIGAFVGHHFIYNPLARWRGWKPLSTGPTDSGPSPGDSGKKRDLAAWVDHLVKRLKDKDRVRRQGAAHDLLYLARNPKDSRALVPHLDALVLALESFKLGVEEDIVGAFFWLVRDTNTQAAAISALFRALWNQNPRIRGRVRTLLKLIKEEVYHGILKSIRDVAGVYLEARTLGDLKQAPGKAIYLLIKALYEPIEIVPEDQVQVAQLLQALDSDAAIDALSRAIVNDKEFPNRERVNRFLEVLRVISPERAGALEAGFMRGANPGGSWFPWLWWRLGFAWWVELLPAAGAALLFLSVASGFHALPIRLKVPLAAILAAVVSITLFWGPHPAIYTIYKRLNPEMERDYSPGAVWALNAGLSLVIFSLLMFGPGHDETVWAIRAWITAHAGVNWGLFSRNIPNISSVAPGVEEEVGGSIMEHPIEWGDVSKWTEKIAQILSLAGLLSGGLALVMMVVQTFEGAAAVWGVSLVIWSSVLGMFAPVLGSWRAEGFPDNMTKLEKASLALGALMLAWALVPWLVQLAFSLAVPAPAAQGAVPLYVLSVAAPCLPKGLRNRETPVSQSMKPWEAWGEIMGIFEREQRHLPAPAFDLPAFFKPVKEGGIEKLQADGLLALGILRQYNEFKKGIKGLSGHELEAAKEDAQWFFLTDQFGLKEDLEASGREENAYHLLVRLMADLGIPKEDVMTLVRSGSFLDVNDPQFASKLAQMRLDRRITVISSGARRGFWEGFRGIPVNFLEDLLNVGRDMTLSADDFGRLLNAMRSIPESDRLTQGLKQGVFRVGGFVTIPAASGFQQGCLDLLSRQMEEVEVQA